jgi:hypothetical protein
MEAGRSHGRRHGAILISSEMKLRRLKNLILLVMSVAGLLGWSGCATTGDDNDNLSARPWNSPKGWEHGLPTQMMQGR